MDNQQGIDQIITKWEADQLLTAIDNLLGQLYSTKISWEKKLDNCLSSKQQSIISTELGETYTNHDQVAKENQLNNLKDRLTQLPVVEIYIAYDPPYNTWQTIALWFRKQLNQSILIDYQIKKSLIGGAIIKYRGSRRDYSLKHWLDTQIKDHQLSKLLKK